MFFLIALLFMVKSSMVVFPTFICRPNVRVRPNQISGKSNPGGPKQYECKFGKMIAS